MAKNKEWIIMRYVLLFIPILFSTQVIFIPIYSYGIISCEHKDSIARCIVKKISHVRNGYVYDFYDEKNDVWYTVASSKIKGNVKGCEKMRVGKSYDFVLQPYYFDRKIAPNLSCVFFIYINGKRIKVPSQSWTSNVFISPNINGKYYCKSFDNWPYINIPERPTRPLTPLR